MPYRESYCDTCQEPADKAGKKAPPGWYRCPACDAAKPRHLLPSRLMLRSTPVGRGNTGLRGTGGGLRDFGVPFGLVLIPVMEGDV